MRTCSHMAIRLLRAAGRHAGKPLVALSVAQTLVILATLVCATLLVQKLATCEGDGCIYTTSETDRLWCQVMLYPFDEAGDPLPQKTTPGYPDGVMQWDRDPDVPEWYQGEGAEVQFVSHSCRLVIEIFKLKGGTQLALRDGSKAGLPHMAMPHCRSDVVGRTEGSLAIFRQGQFPLLWYVGGIGLWVLMSGVNVAMTLLCVFFQRDSCWGDLLLHLVALVGFKLFPYLLLLLASGMAVHEDCPQLLLIYHFPTMYQASVFCSVFILISMAVVCGCLRSHVAEVLLRGGPIVLVLVVMLLGLRMVIFPEARLMLKNMFHWAWPGYRISQDIIALQLLVGVFLLLDVVALVLSLARRRASPAPVRTPDKRDKRDRTGGSRTVPEAVQIVPARAEP